MTHAPPPAPRTNELGQPVGAPVPSWTPRPRPARVSLGGRYARLEPLDPARHADGLWEAYALDAEGRNWTYLPYGPFGTPEAFREWLDRQAAGDDPLFFAIVDAASGQAVGMASYLRIEATVGCIEVGHLNFSPLLQRRPAATEAMFLMMRHAFDDLGYRRYEWKCDSLNEPSWLAAERLGFTFEGIFRQAVVVKGRNRDTTWLSILDGEWPALRAGFEAWLAPENFDAAGQQRRALRACFEAARGA
ncbi:MAG: GNAT family N-acetyltransferase [Chloroflexi bacterium HGW-Chloroflexi-9]|nr:MAG: GNAT family N-acetyltransferase [Chloroflexi bacterium HGW-Chloroflexi-9]